MKFFKPSNLRIDAGATCLMQARFCEAIVPGDNASSFSFASPVDAAQADLIPHLHVQDDCNVVSLPVPPSDLVQHNGEMIDFCASDLHDHNENIPVGVNEALHKNRLDAAVWAVSPKSYRDQF